MDKENQMKKYLNVFLQGFGAAIGFIVSLMIANAVSPLPQFITEKTPATGFLSLPAAMLFSGIVNAVILVWAARRSSFKGFAMTGQLFVLSFGVQTFQTQIETGYFLSAFRYCTATLKSIALSCVDSSHPLFSRRWSR